MPGMQEQQERHTPLLICHQCNLQRIFIVSAHQEEANQCTMHSTARAADLDNGYLQIVILLHLTMRDAQSATTTYTALVHHQEHRNTHIMHLYLRTEFKHGSQQRIIR